MNKPPSENIRILSDKNFSSTVGNGVSLVDFWAAWCGPCKIQGPIVDEIADEMGDQANICKMDMDQNPETARKFGIQNIPTLLIFQNGRLVERFVGVKPKHALVKALKSYI
ncbi:MAG: thioredoxin [Bacteroidales bacterium]|nr:thioredoxin [Bacteroidales bacterium]